MTGIAAEPPTSLPPLSFEASDGDEWAKNVEPGAPRRPKWLAAFGLTVSIGFGFVFGFWFFGPAFDRAISTWGIWIIPVFTAGLAAALVISVVTHELGHLAFGRLVGFRPVLLMVGPMVIHLHGGRLRIGLGSGGPKVGGLAVGLWDESAGSYRWRAAVYICGGPVVSIISGGAMVAAFFALGLNAFDPATHTGLQYSLAVLLLVTGIVSLVFVAANLVPFKTGLFTSDGARLYHLLRWDDEAQRDHVLNVLMALSATTPPREWHDTIVQRCIAIFQGTRWEASALAFAYLQARDRDDLLQAHRHLQQAIHAARGLPKAIRQDIYMETAFFELTVRKDRHSSLEWLDRIDNVSALNDGVAAAVQALLRRGEGDEEAAVRLHAKALKAFECDPFEAAASTQRTWFLEAYAVAAP